MKEDIKTCKGAVEEVLKKDERARNNDKWLIIQTLREMGFKIYIDYDELEDIPAFESITRCRRKLQNDEGKYQADEDIKKKRDKEEEEMKNIHKWYPEEMQGQATFD